MDVCNVLMYAKMSRCFRSVACIDWDMNKLGPTWAKAHGGDMLLLWPQASIALQQTLALLVILLHRLDMQATVVICLLLQYLLW